MDKSAQHRGIRRVASTHLPTVFGIFDLIGFERAGFDRANMANRDREPALVMRLGDLQDGVPLLRIHSQCLTGEVLGSLRCDCRGQLEVALSTIAEQGIRSSHLLAPGGPWHWPDGEATSLRLAGPGSRYDRSERSSGF